MQKNSGFALSASLDNTVRMWNVDKENCLRIFKHFDLVFSVSFHPQVCVCVCVCANVFTNSFCIRIIFTVIVL